MRPRRTLCLVLLLVSGICPAQTQTEDLARLLRDRKIISTEEFERIGATGSPQQIDVLAAMLRDKGVITASEASSLGLKPSPTSIVNRGQPEPAPDPGSDANRKLTIYGTLLFNAFFNSAVTNNADIPSFALPRSPGPQQNFGATARQTRLGLSYAGLNVAGAKLSGTAEVDFFGGSPALTNGINMDVVRMRLAFGRMEWKRLAIEAGQDWTIFAPLNPTSLAEFAIPEFSASGNLWIRTPQIPAEWKSGLGKQRRYLWQVAALDPDIGDNPATFATARLPRAGELGRLPAVETRLAFSNPIGDRTATLGFSGHWGAAKNSSITNGLVSTRNVPSWGAAVDYNLPLSKLLNISGEVFAGRALGVYSGGIAQTVAPLGQPGDNGVGTRGGWVQVQLNFTSKWQTNLAYGIDAPLLRNLSTAGRSKNQTYMGNVEYHLAPHVAVALEWRRFLTNYLNQAAANNRGDHVNLAAAYTF